MNGFDLVCLLLVGGWALLGLMRGLVRQIFGLVGIAAGAVLSRLVCGPLGALVGPSLGIKPGLAVAIAAAVAFFATELAAKALGNRLHESLGTFTGTVDRLGGLALGAAKGGLVAWAMASLIALAWPHVRRAPGMAGLGFDRSQAVALATQTNLVSELASTSPPSSTPPPAAAAPRRSPPG